LRARDAKRSVRDDDAMADQGTGSPRPEIL